MLFESLKDIDSAFGFDHATGSAYDLLVPACLRLMQSLGRPTGDPAPVQYGQIPSERSHALRAFGCLRVESCHRCFQIWIGSS